MDPRCPVIVGVGQVSQRPADPLDGVEPLELMVRAVERAGEDAGAPAILARADAVRVSRGLWAYGDPGRAIAERIGAPGAQTGITPFGGNMVQSLVNATALEIQRGERDVVVLAGAENGYSQAKALKARVRLEVTPAPGRPDWVLEPDKPMVHPAEVARRLVRPIQLYPMFETALRHHLGHDLETHQVHLSRLWERFARVARDNPHAWIRDAPSAETIRTPSPENRMVGWPYPKLMSSNNAVDQGAALILCSLAAARRAGVPEDRLVFPHAGSDADDHIFPSIRANLHSSPAIRIAGARCLELAGCQAADLAHVDLYSCFPVAVEVAAAELGLPLERPLTVTGGLTFGGGPLNNYVMHSIARMVEVLRADRGARGLVTANGGFLSKHAFGVYSSEAPAAGFRHVRPQHEVDALPRRDAVVDHDGPARVEACTVLFGPDAPQSAHVACLLDDGRRTWAESTDPDLMDEMMRVEFVGRPVRIDGKGRFTAA